MQNFLPHSVTFFTEVETDYSKRAKKARVQKQILWIAKKQRILRCLEDAYPNTQSIQDVLM